MGADAIKTQTPAEPTVEELLADPIAKILMAYDGIGPETVRRVLEQARCANGFMSQEPTKVAA